jgi:hypothetical protein
VNGGRRHSEVVQEVIEVVYAFLRIAEDQSTRGWHGQKKVIGGLLLVVRVAPDDLLPVSTLPYQRTE